ncbi:unnamed protein product [Vitrella brassicaformis CCMP3155]|uniref:SH3 domain-containing protein n=2 Tax=Vitrella brassicaformis TaxID=1169539 RepID=A0A0G4GA39_VITBC|nr:unnamed protein product [Vitrella brassicaformis CCMP3155]|eukprot:CEM25728.1 unnamed protein product [Vitrella brassicaformis CCMP3155]
MLIDPNITWEDFKREALRKLTGPMTKLDTRLLTAHCDGAAVDEISLLREGDEVILQTPEYKEEHDDLTESTKHPASDSLGNVQQSSDNLDGMEGPDTDRQRNAGMLTSPERKRILVTYEAEDDGSQVTVRKGDIVQVYIYEDSGWAYGETPSGLRGWFPKHCIADLATPPRVLDPSQPHPHPHGQHQPPAPQILTQDKPGPRSPQIIHALARVNQHQQPNPFLHDQQDHGLYNRQPPYGQHPHQQHQHQQQSNGMQQNAFGGPPPHAQGGGGGGMGRGRGGPIPIPFNASARPNMGRSGSGGAGPGPGGPQGGVFPGRGGPGGPGGPQPVRGGPWERPPARWGSERGQAAGGGGGGGGPGMRPPMGGGGPRGPRPPPPNDGWGPRGGQRPMSFGRQNVSDQSDASPYHDTRRGTPNTVSRYFDRHDDRERDDTGGPRRPPGGGPGGVRGPGRPPANNGGFGAFERREPILNERHFCTQCHKTEMEIGRVMEQCEGCGYARYCSKACNQKDAQRHTESGECEKFRRAREQFNATTEYRGPRGGSTNSGSFRGGGGGGGGGRSSFPSSDGGRHFAASSTSRYPPRPPGQRYIPLDSPPSRPKGNRSLHRDPGAGRMASIWPDELEEQDQKDNTKDSDSAAVAENGNKDKDKAKDGKKDGKKDSSGGSGSSSSSSNATADKAGGAGGGGGAGKDDASEGGKKASASGGTEGDKN